MPAKTIKLILAILLSIAVSSGCAKKDTAKPALKIGSVNITAAEFEKDYKNSQYAADSSPAARKAFLDNFITRILILKEAERLGYDKDPEFLKDVEFFWRQSLVKLTLDRRIKEIAANTSVSESEIKKYYDDRQDGEFRGRTLGSVKDEIKWMLVNKKQQDAINAWLDSLKEGSGIKIDYKALDIEG